MAAEAEHQPQAQEKRPEPSREEEDDKANAPPRLRRLELVRVAAAYAVVFLVALYGFAKSRAGSLRPKIDTVESAVGPVVRPLYGRFRHTPLALLIFLDRKVDGMVEDFEWKVPECLKAASSQACAAARSMPEAGKELLAKAYVKKVRPAAKNLYLRHGPAVGRLAVSTWRSFNRLPLFPQVAQIAVPAAVQLAEKYNMAVAGRLPPIPIKLIAKFFTDRGVEVEVNDAR